MKKLFILPLLAISFSANAENIATPASMASNTIPLKAASAEPKKNSELEGYSLAFLAYHYNDACKLGLPKTLIDALAGEIENAQKTNDISKQDVDNTVAEANRVYTENPTKFCEDASKVANTIKALFMPK